MAKKMSIYRFHDYARRLSQTNDISRISVILKEFEDEFKESMSKSLEDSLGECVAGNEYKVVPHDDGRFWIEHKHVGSGEPLKQWIKSN